MFVDRNVYDSNLVTVGNGSWVQAFGGSNLLAKRGADALFSQHVTYDYEPARNILGTWSPGRSYDSTGFFFRGVGFAPVDPTRIVSDPGTGVTPTLKPYTGNNSLRWNINGSNSDLMDFTFLPARGGGSAAGLAYNLSYTIATSDVTHTAFTILVSSYDFSGKWLGDEFSTTTAAGAWGVSNNTWLTLNSTVTASNAAQFIKLSCYTTNSTSTASAPQYTWIDNIQFYPTPQIPSGTSFPTFPPTNTQFFRTDLGVLYFYNGTTWSQLAPSAITQINASSAGITTTETNVISAQLPAGYIRQGTTFRLRFGGRVTSTVANTATFRLRIGTANNNTDGIVTSVQPNATTTNTLFTGDVLYTQTTAGAGGAGNANMVVSGMTATPSVIVGNGTALVTVNTTVTNFIHLTGVTGAATTTLNFDVATIEIVTP